jgi:hypothetical protein
MSLIPQQSVLRVNMPSDEPVPSSSRRPTRLAMRTESLRQHGDHERLLLNLVEVRHLLPQTR